jgi:hypothetical protein
MPHEPREADPGEVVDFNGEPTRIRDLPPAMAAMFGYGHILSPGAEWRKVLPGVWPYTPQTCRRSDCAWPGTWIDDEHLACTGCGLDCT